MGWRHWASAPTSKSGSTPINELTLKLLLFLPFMLHLLLLLMLLLLCLLLLLSLLVQLRLPASTA